MELCITRMKSFGIWKGGVLEDGVEVVFYQKPNQWYKHTCEVRALAGKAWAQLNYLLHRFGCHYRCSKQQYEQLKQLSCKQLNNWNGADVIQLDNSAKFSGSNC